MRHWIVLQHVEWESPGLIAAEARERGIELEFRRMDREHMVPEAVNLGGLIVMGGPMGVYECGRYPFLQEECRLIANMVNANRPVLGVCLGAQLLAAALGARVYKGPIKEIGLGNVDFERAAAKDPVFSALPSPLPVFHWHGDTFDLPAGSELLAGNRNYRHQAFRFGKHAYGLQFHVEPDDGIWQSWESRLPWHTAAIDARQRLEIEMAGRHLFARFFDVALQTNNLRPVTAPVTK